MESLRMKRMLTREVRNMATKLTAKRFAKRKTCRRPEMKAHIRKKPVKEQPRRETATMKNA